MIDNLFNPLTSADFDQQTEFLLDGFIAKRLITLIYANGGMGKSFLSMAIAKYAAIQGMDVYYLDFDNSLVTLTERNVEQLLLNPCPSLRYVHASKVQMTANELLQNIANKAYGQCYQNSLFVFDSLRDFADVNNDAAAMRLGESLKKIREAGGTIIGLHHSNKDGKNYQGSNNLRNSIDNMYKLIKIDAPSDQIRWILEVEKERVGITDQALAVKVNDLSMMTLDITTARLTDAEQVFITKIKVALTETPGLNKTELLETAGYTKDDKTARDRLDQFETIYWQSTKVKNAFTYHLLN